MNQVINFIKKEAVLCIAAILAIGSMLLVPPDKQYLSYIDIPVLVLLFGLMAVMTGFEQVGLFHKLAGNLLKKVTTFRSLTLVLVLLCFFSSMWITNDVALITFVPFSILVLKMANLKEKLIPVIVMQTVAANLGSMLTPIGNPQNLYLYSISGMGIVEFLKIMALPTGVSLLLILAFCFSQNKSHIQGISMENFANSRGREELSVYQSRVQTGLLFVLFIVCLLSVLHICPSQVVFILTIVICVIIWVYTHNTLLLKRVDYCLLFTFVSFFVFIGNMGRVEWVREWIQKLLDGRELLISFLCSQVISNVPAAILLSGFTEKYEALLLGVNIGGLGTLIASLASLISYKLFSAEVDRQPEKGLKSKYLLYFTGINVIFALILLGCVVIM